MGALFNPYYEIDALLFDLALLIVPVGVAVVRGFRPVAAWIDRWEQGHGMRLTDRGRAFVSPYLQLTKRFRTVGFAIGWSLLPVWSIVEHDGRTSVPRPVRYAWLALYAIAAVAGEAWANRTQPQVAVASLDPRRMSDYLPRTALVLEAASPIVAGIVAAAYAILPWRATGFGPSTTTVVTRVVAIAVLVGFAFLVQASVVRRPQRVDTDELPAADDALRSNAVHMIGFATLLAVGLIGGTMLLDLGSRVDSQLVRWIAAPLGAVIPLLGLLGFVAYANPLVGFFVKRRTYATRDGV